MHTQHFTLTLKNKQRQQQLLFVALFAAIFLLAVFERVWMFGVLPLGLNQDEAYSGYNAWSLLHEGIDSSGDHFPVYFEVWGSGQSALNTYLMMPLVALFGLKAWVIRLPQMIVSLFTVLAIYGIVKRLWNHKAGLCAMFFFAIAPWHIMMSRWALDCNFAPGFVAFGLYFFIRGLEKPNFLILSGLLYGLSLYGYATIWPFVPLIILLQVLYALWTKKLRICWQLVLFCVLFGLLALPLFLFLLINMDFLPEVQTTFFSIPKMNYLRSDEVSLLEWKSHLKRLLRVVLLQTDRNSWNTIEEFGQYYHISLPFFFLGLFLYLKRFVQCLKKRAFAPEALILIWFLAGGLLGLTILVNVNKVNLIFPPVLIMTGTSFYFLYEDLKNILVIKAQHGILSVLIYAVKCIIPVIAILYLFQLSRFNSYYFTTYAEDPGDGFLTGMEEALEIADAAADASGAAVYIPEYRAYPVVLFYEQIPASSYQEANRNGADFSDLGRHKRNYDVENPDTNSVYILGILSEDVAYFSEELFDFYPCAHQVVIVPKAINF